MNQFTALRRAFSLIEVLVVVVVIGILAAVVVPNTIMAGDTARVTATAQDLRSIESAVVAYKNKHGIWPRDVTRAVLPTELAEFFTKSDPFAKTVPVGGVYDYDGATSSRGPRISIRGSTGNPIPSDATALELDEEMDDGVLTTGRLRKSGGTIEFFVVPGD